MEDKITHYRFQKGIYKIKHYKDVCNIPEYNSEYIRTEKRGVWNRKNIEQHSDEKKFLEHFSDIMKGLEMRRITVVVEEHDDKFSVKAYINIKKRRVGSRNFYVRKHTIFSTYSFKTKNLYVGRIVKSKKKIISKKVRVNNFEDVVNPYHIISDLIMELRMLYFNRLSSEDGLFIGPQDYEDSQAGAEMDKIRTAVNNIIVKRTGIKPSSEVSDNTSLGTIMYRLYLLDNGFKIPNSFSKYIRIYIPKKELKKDKNLVKTFMRLNNLTGSKIRKYLNDNNNISIEYVKMVFQIIGVDYFNRLKPNVFTDLESNYYHNERYWLDLSKAFSKRDFQQIVIGLNSGVDFSSLIEHFVFRSDLKKYNHNYKIKFKNRTDFINEHSEITELLQTYRNGKVKRFYGLGVKDKIEEPILSMIGVDFYPVLLTTTKEYNSESTVQNNCVRTYSEKPHNIIVSLRMGSKDSTERATVEYQFRRNEIIRVQTRSKYNNDVPETWNTTLEVLDERLSQLYHSGKLMLPKIEKESANGFTITRNSVFEEYEKGKIVSMVPRWDEPIGDEDSFYDLDFF